MTATKALEQEQAQITRAQQARAHAEAYFAAESELARFAKTKQGKRLKELAEDKKQAIDTLAAIYPVERNHEDALHGITVFGNSTATFLHREDDSIKWKEIATGIWPHLTNEQRRLYDSLLSAHTKSRVTKTLKK